MFWPSYTARRQEYLRITKEMTSDSVKNYLLASEFDLWTKVLPSVQKALAKGGKSSKEETAETGYCEKDGECQP